MSSSKIEWTEATWNPLTGCNKISAGCKNCYAERMAKRLQLMGVKHYKNGFKLSLHEDSLSLPLGWKKPKFIFVNSMSDLFHDSVPLEFIQKVFATMKTAHWHVFQVLTKRSENLKKYDKFIDWPANVWMGVSVENELVKHRISDLAATNAITKFLSLEPLIGPLQKLPLKNIDWVIVGGESGPGARPMLEQWVLDIKKQCIAKDVPFFFKQWGGINKKKSGRILDNRTWDEMPDNQITYQKNNSNVYA